MACKMYFSIFTVYLEEDTNQIHWTSPSSDAKMILWDSMGCSWTVNYILSKDDNLLSGGWMAFMQATNLKVGDLCLFELIKPLEIKCTSLSIQNDPQN
ncbi:hypothetical protein QJS10_CPB22g00765 [Acorus calamus]|uniref:TF-B3 domain-containing protein n=1 Tax=Acorus calamus TaxID=4465 RepID=A0AAV9C296_ACOCL|nr:hypothetical protein QJS10_CPB22g00765 [Acorus calamus]